MKTKTKSIFTQLSAIVLFFVAMSLVTLVGIRLFGISVSEKPQGTKLLLFLVFICPSVVVSTGLTFWIWSRVLVFLKILSPQDAKGYPFSKPWQERQFDSEG